VYSFTDVDSIVKRQTNLEVGPNQCCFELEDHSHLLTEIHPRTLKTAVERKQCFNIQETEQNNIVDHRMEDRCFETVDAAAEAEAEQC
jgi:hypothetical protein